MNKLDLRKTAHLIVDVQRDYCSPDGALARARGFDMKPMVEVAKRIDSFVNATRNILKPIWLRTEESPETLAPNLIWAQGKPLTLCKIGTPGYDYFVVQPRPNEKEFHKVHYCAFNNPGLEKYLKENDIDTIVYSGVIASRCVYATMVAGSALGFKSVILADLVENPTELQIEKKEFMKVAGLLFAKLINSKDILELIKKVKIA